MTWIIGIRSFAAEVADWATDAGLEVSGFLDPSGDAPQADMAHGLPVHPLEHGQGGQAIIGTGEDDRRETVTRALHARIELRGLRHSSAHVSPAASVDPSAVLGPQVVVGAATTIGEHAVFGRGVLVGHHSTIGAFVTLGPGANIAGNTRIGEGVEVAMGALVRDHLEVGAHARVAMGAVVVSDVEAGVEVRGIPARAVGR